MHECEESNKEENKNRSIALKKKIGERGIEMKTETKVMNMVQRIEDSVSAEQSYDEGYTFTKYIVYFEKNTKIEEAIKYMKDYIYIR